jgi:hypothetical protein
MCFDTQSFYDQFEFEYFMVISTPRVIPRAGFESRTDIY